MKKLNVSEVRKTLPKLADEVRSTREPVLITRRGRPLAKIVPCTEKELSGRVNSLPLRGMPITVSPDFDEPLDGEWEALD